MSSELQNISLAKKRVEQATFAGGCFWCMVTPFEELPGIHGIVSGYMGGWKEDPTYEEVKSGTTGHAEVVQITFEPEVFPYRNLLDLYWVQIDPTDPDGQFHDRGSQYRTAIFYHNEEQRAEAEASKQELAASGRFDKPIVTEITAASRFYPAEDYHQNFHRKNPGPYKADRRKSGRDEYIAAHWSIEKNPVELRQKLTDMQFAVTQLNGTEPPFRNEFWDHHEEGLYVDIVSGEPLFTSMDKFDSGCGWPSFTKPALSDHVKENVDTTHGMIRTEVRSKRADSHLGHVFPDGPREFGGLRYCINSAALRFIPKADLAKEGYGVYAEWFENKK